MPVVLLVVLSAATMLILWSRIKSAPERTLLMLGAGLVAALGVYLVRGMYQQGAGLVLYAGLAVGLVVSALVAWAVREGGRRGAWVACLVVAVLIGASLGVVAMRRDLCVGWGDWSVTCGPQAILLIALPMAACTASVLGVGRRQAKLGEQVVVGAFTAYAILPLAFTVALAWGQLTTGRGP